MIKDNGGPAFPVTKTVNESYCDEAGYARTRQVLGLTGGMALRDYFAAKAMQGLLAQAEGAAPTSDVSFGAKYAYQMADAMLAERVK